MKQTSLLRKGHLIDITVKNIWFYFFQCDSEFYLVVGCLWFVLVPATASIDDRFSSDLIVLYDFQSARGRLVRDRSGIEPKLNLWIQQPSKVRRARGSLRIQQHTTIRTRLPATKITKAVKRSGEITIEIWLRSIDLKQSGPARIITLSQDSSNRNFTLGQNGNQFNVRLRTTDTNNNGLPSLSSNPNSLSQNLTHLVYVRQKNGQTQIYINGHLNQQKQISGKPTNWNDTYHLALGNELSEGRPWLGSYHLVAIYNSALSSEQILQKFQIGIDPPENRDNITNRSPSDRESFFDEEIVPILSRHCLECHDTSTNYGELDLSQKSTAYSLSYGQPVIIPHQSADSLLWKAVEFDQMPLDREPISHLEKRKLKIWIDQGAVWTTEEIDPLAHNFDQKVDINWVRRLTVSEYINTVQMITGVDISESARNILPPDIRTDGFSNTAYNLSVDLKHIAAYDQLAQIIVDQMDILAFVKQYSSKLDLTGTKMRSFIMKMGRDFLRGELNEIEVSTFQKITTAVNSSGGTTEEAVALVLKAMLLSPRFIYHIEYQRGDGQYWSVSEFELANRISYAIWGSAPDQKLLDLAENGALFNPKVMNQQIDRMLQSPKAIRRSLEFVDDWLNLDRLSNIRPDIKRFPRWQPNLASDMRAETLAFFEEVVWHQNRPLSDLLNAQLTFVTPRLAEHYGLPSPTNINAESLIQYDLNSLPERGGILTQGSILTIGGDEASMVTRGLFILTDLLRSGVKDPPPCVDTTPVSTEPGRSQRQISESRVANQACGGCHEKFEPLAYGLEVFDGIGRFHQFDDHGNQLRQDGSILFPFQRETVFYHTSAELMNLMAESDRVKQNLTWKLAQFVAGRPLGQPDAIILDQIYQQAQHAGGTYTSVMRAIVQSDLVQKIKTETEDEN